MKTKTTSKSLNKMTQIQLISGIVDAISHKQCSPESITEAMPMLKKLAKRIKVSTDAALMFAVFANKFDDNKIEISDLANFLDCTQIKILTYWDAIDQLVQLKYIGKRKNLDEEYSFFVPADVMTAVRENRIYTPIVYTNLTSEQWTDRLSDLLHRRDRGLISYDLFMENLESLIRNNQHLTIARELVTIQDKENQMLFAGMIDLFIQNNDNHIMRSDVEDLFEESWMARSHARQLERGEHPLQIDGLVEHSNSDGQVESDAWMLTQAAKDRFLSELDILTPNRLDKELRAPNTIVDKNLYFNASVSKQLKQLQDLLQPNRFTHIQDNLVKHGMRKGFACIFYGSPGTGKTETVLQLARQTGRSIFQVDVPNLRSKWVGDTEKNVKAIFDRYRSYCKRCEVAPILLFNEADAVLCRRNEGATGSVDKMENAMQNIILQEMETLDGIMIATTNLTNNLDAAFERRFLYKIEFSKPTPNESKHIWHAMLPDLTDDETYLLANKYDFSGGQIENIARKQIVDSILLGTERPSMEAIRSACDTERFNKSQNKPIGFN